MFSNYITGRQLLRVKRILSSHCWDLVQKKNIKTLKFENLQLLPKKSQKKNKKKQKEKLMKKTIDQFFLLLI
jgi:hypothetical protein